MYILYHNKPTDKAIYDTYITMCISHTNLPTQKRMKQDMELAKLGAEHRALTLEIAGLRRVRRREGVRVPPLSDSDSVLSVCMCICTHYLVQGRGRGWCATISHNAQHPTPTNIK